MDCCEKKKDKSLRQGILYGLIPHIGCIAFIIGSILGVTVLMNFFKPVLMNRYFFHALIGISLGFATLSSILYLRKNKMLSWPGIKKKKRYLGVMYGSTVGINLLLFMVIFPLLANISMASPTGGVIIGDSSLTLKVDIPCPGHAPLISNELRTISGVSEARFSFPNYFAVKYDSQKTSKNKILSLEIFKTYSAKVTEEKVPQTKTSGGCCGGSGSCGGSCGGCGGY